MFSSFADGYMLIRYINICFKISLFLTIWGIVVLVPIYSNAQNKHFSWNKYTLANIPNDPSAHQLWVPAISAYIFATYFCHLMYGEYQNFVKKRIQYLIQGDPDTPPQTYYTIMVEKVPMNLRSAPALENFFENVFPGDVHSVEVALDLKELDLMTKHRRQTRDSLEKSIALAKATGRQQLQWIRRDYYENSYPMAIMKGNFIARLFGFVVVDAIDHKTRMLAELNGLVRALQTATLERRHFLELQETRRHQNLHGSAKASAGSKIRRLFKAGTSLFLAERDESLQKSRCCALKGQSKLEPDAIGVHSCIAEEPKRFASFKSDDAHSHTLTADRLSGATQLEENEVECQGNSIKYSNYSHYSLQHSSMNVGVGGEDSKSNFEASVVAYTHIAPEVESSSEGMTHVTTPASAHKCTSTACRESKYLSDDGNPLQGQELSNPDCNMDSTQCLVTGKVSASGLCRGALLLSNTIATGLVAFGRRILAMTLTGSKWILRSLLEGVRAVELLTVGACYKTSSTAFVTLKSRVATSSAHQMFLSHVHYSMTVKSAPNPRDCIWENIPIPARQIEMRKTIADACFIVGAVFWSIVVGFITAIANLESLSKELPWLDAYRNTVIYDVLNQYLAVGVLLILLGILPFIFDMIARSYEGRKLESEIQNSIMTRYFYYQLANVFVSVGLGSLANSIHQILQSPSSILSILGTSLPTLSVYFTNLLIVKTFTTVPLELLRIWPLICVLSVRSCRDKNKCTIRELKRGTYLTS